MGLLSAFAPSYPWILILRMCVGMGVGGVPQSVTLYSEFLPKQARGRCIMMIEVFWAIGTCAEVVLGEFLVYNSRSFIRYCNKSNNNIIFSNFDYASLWMESVTWRIGNTISFIYYCM